MPEKAGLAQVILVQPLIANCTHFCRVFTRIRQPIPSSNFRGTNSRGRSTANAEDPQPTAFPESGEHFTSTFWCQVASNNHSAPQIGFSRRRHTMACSAVRKAPACPARTQSIAQIYMRPHVRRLFGFQTYTGMKWTLSTAEPGRLGPPKDACPALPKPQKGRLNKWQVSLSSFGGEGWGALPLN